MITGQPANHNTGLAIGAPLAPANGSLHRELAHRLRAAALAAAAAAAFLLALCGRAASAPRRALLVSNASSVSPPTPSPSWSPWRTPPPARPDRRWKAYLRRLVASWLCGPDTSTARPASSPPRGKLIVDSGGVDSGQVDPSSVAVLRRVDSQTINHQLSTLSTSPVPIPAGRTPRRARGSGTLDVQGYVIVKMCGRRYRLHRLVASAFLPGGIPPGCDVHHKNGHRRDNRPENLAFLIRPAHTRHHFGAAAGVFLCAACGRPVLRPRTPSRHHQCVCCSRRCRNRVALAKRWHGICAPARVPLPPEEVEAMLGA